MTTANVLSAPMTAVFRCSDFAAGCEQRFEAGQPMTPCTCPNSQWLAWDMDNVPPGATRHLVWYIREGLELSQWVIVTERWPEPGDLFNVWGWSMISGGMVTLESGSGPGVPHTAERGLYQVDTVEQSPLQGNPAVHVTWHRIGELDPARLVHRGLMLERGY